MISRALITRAFGRAASHYDEHADLQRKVAEKLVSAVAQNDPLHMIDLGCGTGYCSLLLRRRFPDAGLYALDMALPMLQTTRQHRISDCNLVCGDIQAIPLQGNLFDLIVSSLTMQWCMRGEVLFAELFRIARPGAQVLLSTFGPQTLVEVKNAWARVDGYVHVNQFEPLVGLIQVAHAAGFSVVYRTEIVQRFYDSIKDVGKELKGLGAYNMNREQAQGFTGRKALAAAERVFAENATADGIPVTFEIFYLELKKPDVVHNGVE